MEEEIVKVELSRLIEIARSQPGISEIQEVYGEFKKQRAAIAPYLRTISLPIVTFTSNSSTS